MNEDFKTSTKDTVPKKNYSFRDEAWETFRFLCIAIVIVVPIRLFIAQPFIVSGASMDPTFKDRQYLIVDELSYHLDDPLRGDVAIFKYPRNPKQYFIKRVIGLPGETVVVNGQGQVFIKDIDGNITMTLSEPYVAHMKDDSVELKLGQNEYFMMGDNRSGSFDSRSWGAVDRELIVGKAFLRLFPLTEADILPGQFRQ